MHALPCERSNSPHMCPLEGLTHNHTYILRSGETCLSEMSQVLTGSLHSPIFHYSTVFLVRDRPFQVFFSFSRLWPPFQRPRKRKRIVAVKRILPCTPQDARSRGSFEIDPCCCCFHGVVQVILPFLRILVLGGQQLMSYWA